MNKDPLGVLTEGINKIVDSKITNAKFDKTFKAVVINKLEDNKYLLSANGSEYKVGCKSNLEINEVVNVTIMENNKNNLIVEPINIAKTVQLTPLNNVILGGRNRCVCKNNRCLINLYMTTATDIVNGGNLEVMSIQNGYSPTDFTLNTVLANNVNGTFVGQVYNGKVSIFNFSGVTLPTGSLILGQITWDI